MTDLQIFNRADLFLTCPKCNNEMDENERPTFAVKWLDEEVARPDAAPKRARPELMLVYCRDCGFNFHRLPADTVLERVRVA